MGRDWLDVIRLNWREIYLVKVENDVSSLIADYKELFAQELGKLKGVEVIDLDIDEGASPRFLKARPVPFALRNRLDEELDRLLANDIIEPVQYSKWAAPIVPVVKGDGSIRICGDYKTTINPAARFDTYRIPRVEELFARLANGNQFSKLVLSHAYQQLVLSEKSRELVTINTHRRLFRYKRLPFDISTAPSVFQRTMESLLAGIPGVAVYLDDLLITGESTEEHLKNLKRVLDVLHEAGLRLKKEKCAFLKDEVDCLGHTITAKGLHPTGDKVEAIPKAPEPTNVKEALRKMSGPLHTRLSRFLLGYRTTPQATTKQSPAELLMNRKLRTRITSVLPDVNATVEKKQFAQTIAHTTHALREFNVVDDVLVRNYARGNQWLPGKITDRTGPVSYVVNVSVDGATLKWKCHVDQLRSRVSSSSTARKQDYANEGVVPTLDEDDVINSDNDNKDREDIHEDQVDIRKAREDDFDENRDVNRDAGTKGLP
eukprot:XP_011667710.1 PREDICTED: uncharacterized protein K02A2.6-like [Strongylocentrotus purpuratus]